MSFAQYKTTISSGDTAIVYIGYKKMTAITINPNETTQTPYGALKHSNIIGVPFGSKVACSKGYVFILHPTPELWTLTLPHRTQILYSADISLIVLQLDLRIGSVVLESGTGSGSLSHAIIRTVMPTGHLYTFEFHKERAEFARSDFRQHGLADYVTVDHRDVCTDGFQKTNEADAVFLDIPQPWLAIESATKSLKASGGRICSFSPCIEQVQKTCSKLSECRFREIETIECLRRNLDVKTCEMPTAVLGLSSISSGSGEKKVRLTSLGGDDENAGVKLSSLKSNDKPPHSSPSDEKYSYKTATLSPNLLGHTGYLTFASLYHSDV